MGNLNKEQVFAQCKDLLKNNVEVMIMSIYPPNPYTVVKGIWSDEYIKGLLNSKTGKYELSIVNGKARFRPFDLIQPKPTFNWGD